MWCPATSQVKNLPDDLHAALAARAKSEGVTMSDYVTRILGCPLVTSDARLSRAPINDVTVTLVR